MSATPSAMRSASHAPRSCSAIGTSAPSGPVRAGRRASVSSISASSPATSPSPGSSRCTMRASRIASADSSARCRSGPAVQAYPSLKMRYSTCSTEGSRSARSAGAGIRNGSPLSRMLCLARVIRRVMVASGTRNARAISAVVRPPTARRVSAICEAGDSAGWQHMNSRISVSSVSAAERSAAGTTSSSGSSRRATVSSRRRRAASARSRSVSRRDATVTSQPRGLSGTPCSGHCSEAASSASCTASSAASKWPYRRTTAPRTCGASVRSRSSSAAGTRLTAPGRRTTP